MTRRGFTFIELLVALLLLGAVLSGLIGLWSFGFNTTRHSQDLGVAYNIGRREIEKTRTVGFMLVLEGTQTTGYDGLGNPTSEPSPHFTAVTTLNTLPDANGQINTGCLRRLTVQVTSRDSADRLFQSTTYFTRGGL